LKKENNQIKKRIAIITHGGIGEENIPAIINFIEHLSVTYDITAYSLSKFSKTFAPKNYKAKYSPFNYNTKLFLRVLWTSIIISKDHVMQPYQAFHGLWAFPAGWLATIFGKLFNKPSVVTFKGGEIVDLPEINYGFYHSNRNKKIIQWTAKNTNCIVSQSFYYAQKIKALGLEYKRMEIIAGGIDTDLFCLNTSKKLEAPYQFLHIANLNKVKDQTSLLKAFSIINEHINCQLHIAGTDTLNGEVQSLAQVMNLNNKIVFYGKLSQQELVSLYNKAHFFLLTSLSESQAVVVNEALASGVVVCGTRVGLIADLENEITLAVDVKEAEGLAAKVLQLIKNPELYYQLQKKGINWSNNNDINYSTEKYHSLYKSLLS
jgi:glycosyltransferase involved in cell wall biosynthesis